MIYLSASLTPQAGSSESSTNTVLLVYRKNRSSKSETKKKIFIIPLRLEIYQGNGSLVFFKI